MEATEPSSETIVAQAKIIGWAYDKRKDCGGMPYSGFNLSISNINYLLGCFKRLCGFVFYFGVMSLKTGEHYSM